MCLLIVPVGVLDLILYTVSRKSPAKRVRDEDERGRRRRRDDDDRPRQRSRGPEDDFKFD